MLEFSLDAFKFLFLNYFEVSRAVTFSTKMHENIYFRNKVKYYIIKLYFVFTNVFNSEENIN